MRSNLFNHRLRVKTQVVKFSVNDYVKIIDKESRFFGKIGIVTHAKPNEYWVKCGTGRKRGDMWAPYYDNELEMSSLEQMKNQEIIHEDFPKTYKARGLFMNPQIRDEICSNNIALLISRIQDDGLDPEDFVDFMMNMYFRPEGVVWNQVKSWVETANQKLKSKE